MGYEFTRGKGRGAEKEGKKLLFVRHVPGNMHKFFTSVIVFNLHNALEWQPSKLYR